MRNIKFRGKRIDNNEWIKGDLCKSISGSPCIMPNAFFMTRELEEAEEDEPQIISDSLAIGGFYPVIPETVGQYTEHKDMNGIEVYEGDILRDIKDDSWVLPGLIGGSFFGMFVDAIRIQTDFEIIGNEIDNPGLWQTR